MSTTPTKPAKPTAAKPAHEIRIPGILVRATIWKNDTDKGPRFNTTFERSYRTEAGEWKTSDSFGQQDLLVLAHVATEAFRWIAEQPIGPECGR